jgi:hypothetical protein
LVGDFSAEKQVELAGELAFRPPRTFGDGFDQPVILGEPMHDQAALRQPGEADECGLSGLHTGIFRKSTGFGDGNPVAKNS